MQSMLTWHPTSPIPLVSSVVVSCWSYAQICFQWFFNLSLMFLQVQSSVLQSRDLHPIQWAGLIFWLHIDCYVRVVNVITEVNSTLNCWSVQLQIRLTTHISWVLPCGFLLLFFISSKHFIHANWTTFAILLPITTHLPAIGQGHLETLSYWFPCSKADNMYKCATWTIFWYRTQCFSSI